jgi:putative YphP/YqiW family bacilliredoxin
MYDPRLVQPMRQELTGAGFTELLTPEDVDKAIGAGSSGTVLLVINSVCGCAAGGARPGVIKALNNSAKPDQLTTVFAGQDKQATDKARSYILGYPPSSPAAALFKDGKLVYFMPRQEIEGFTPDQIAQKLANAFNDHCA